MTVQHTALAAGLALVLAACACSTSQPATGGGSPSGGVPTAVPKQFTPVLASVSTTPVPVKGTDNRVYLVYELFLNNIASIPATLISVATVDAKGGAVLQERSGDDLLQHDKPVGTADALPPQSDDLVRHVRVIGQAPGAAPPTAVVIGAGQLAIVWMDPSLPAGRPIPISLRHVIRVTYPSAPNPLIPAQVTETVAQTVVSSKPAPVIVSPLQGKRWLDGNGCCDEVTPHRGAVNPLNGAYRVAERFAIDWVQLDGEGRAVTGDPTQLSSYPYYGAPIHAVADGEIVVVSDGLADQPPGADPPVGSLTPDQYGGNHIVERFLQNGVTYYAVYEHLKPRSATDRVKVGQSVKAGATIGLLGNSGNTSAPHLHFHLTDSPDDLLGDGLPYAFQGFTVTGRAAGTAAIEAVETGQPLTMVAGFVPGARKDALPLYLDVVDLGGAR